MKRSTFVIVETEINMLNRSITAEKTEEFAPADLQDLLDCTDSFVNRHIGPTETEIEKMLAVLGVATVEELIAKTVPSGIRLQTSLNLAPALSEYAALAQLKAIASKNQVFRSFIGMGYHDCITPPVILRNILENPGWYTAYTPYQAEIAQGRLEALLNFQTLITSLTGLEIANASLLDEGTAAAEAMSMSYGLCKTKANAFFISSSCHPQTIEVVKTRAIPLGIDIIIEDHRLFDFQTPIFGALLQYPATDGVIYDYREFIAKARHLAPDKLRIAEAEFKKLEAAGIIRRSNSAWASPLHMVAKKDGSWRPCGDYRRLNTVTTPDRYPLPNMQDLANGLDGCTIFSKIDLVKGYHS